MDSFHANAKLQEKMEVDRQMYLLVYRYKSVSTPDIKAEKTPG